MWGSIKSKWVRMLFRVGLFQGQDVSQQEARSESTKNLPKKQKRTPFGYEKARLFFRKVNTTIRSYVEKRFKMAIRLLGVFRANKRSNKEPARIVEEERSQHIVKAIYVAFSYWYFFSKDRGKRTTFPIGSAVTRSKTDVHKQSIGDKEAGFESGYTRWVIFAIIFYLALLRESRNTNSGGFFARKRAKRTGHVNKKKLAISVANPIGAARIVIFTIAS